ncbi:MAG: ABC transporter ATP-binding protein, partial [Candidatus Hydrogenedentes bacterium]|nr:ABC transporter ATP-binding protein [Candidatus Hydrogenedentota bacterium]
MTSLWQLLRGNRLRYGAAIVSTIIATLFMFVLPRVFQGAIDFAIDGKELDSPLFVRHLVAWIGPQDYWARNLWIITVSILALTCLSGVFTYLHGWLAASASESAAKSLRERLYDHLQHLPCRYYDHTPTGDLVQRCSSDVETVRMFLAMQVSDIGRSCILLGAGLMFMLPISPIMTLMSTVFLPAIATFSVMFFLKVRKTFKKSDEAEGKMTAMLQENLTCIRVVRAFAQQEFEIRRFAEKNAAYRQRWFSLIKLFAIFWPVSTLLCISQIALVLTFGSYMVMRGQLTVGMLFAFLTYVNLFLWPIRRMGRVLSETGKAIVSLGRIEEILDQPREDELARPTPAVARSCDR